MFLCVCRKPWSPLPSYITPCVLISSFFFFFNVIAALVFLSLHLYLSAGYEDITTLNRVFQIHIFFKIGGQLCYNIVLASAIQRHESAPSTHMATSS